MTTTAAATPTPTKPPQDICACNHTKDMHNWRKSLTAEYSRCLVHGCNCPEFMRDDPSKYYPELQKKQGKDDPGFPIDCPICHAAVLSIVHDTVTYQCGGKYEEDPGRKSIYIGKCRA